MATQACETATHQGSDDRARNAEVVKFGRHATLRW